MTMTKTDLARLWREVNGGNRWPSDVDAFVEELLKQPRCMVPPEGWTCTRKAGHSGPCAAVQQGTTPHQQPKRSYPMKFLCEVLAFVLVVVVILIFAFLFDSEPSLWSALQDRAMQAAKNTECKW